MILNKQIAIKRNSKLKIHSNKPVRFLLFSLKFFWFFVLIRNFCQSNLLLHVYVYINEGLGRQDILKNPCKFINTIYNELHFLLYFLIVLVNATSIGLDGIKVIVLFIAVFEILKLLLFSDLGSPVKNFLRQVDQALVVFHFGLTLYRLNQSIIG